ncbi:MAG: HAMP domain-containing protein [Leptospiraceae bacterium]|nr:HAMP domain-containing protein [Leptospiraceae bacterium]MDW8307510.1 adenylate/guanylate cyclase domain-containing protein [Leptospiraceae bacterium]
MRLTTSLVSEKEQRRLEKIKKDQEYKANEIRFGIRKKLILLFSLLISLIVLGLTLISTRQQTKSLLEEKDKQARIIGRGLLAAIRSRLVEIYGIHAEKIKAFTSEAEYVNFYRQNEFIELLFEDIDGVKKQPDLVYAYVLGKHNIVLGHTRADVKPYSKFSFPAGVESYLDLLTQKQLPEMIATKIEHEIQEDNNRRVIEVLDYAMGISFKDNPQPQDYIGELHIGISLESVNQQIFMTKVNLQLVGLIALGVGVFVAIVFASLIARPIQKVIAGMRRVSQGDFSADVTVRSRDEVGLLSKTFNIMIKGMSILVSPEVAQVVLSGEDLLKGGQKRVVTVLFSDVRSFTTISESLTPHEVVLMLNEYLEIMTDIIIKHGGVVDKFVGDEIFAVFGAPFDHPQHPLSACATALEMAEALAKHNAERRKQGKKPIEIGIGINTGEVISGAMGSTKRVDYTSIGDSVNLGARLEGTNKVYGTLCIISEFTYEYVKDDVVVRELDLIRVKGKNEPVKIYELIALTPAGAQKEEKYVRELQEAKEKKKRAR